MSYIPRWHDRWWRKTTPTWWVWLLNVSRWCDTLNVSDIMLYNIDYQLFMNLCWKHWLLLVGCEDVKEYRKTIYTINSFCDCRKIELSTLFIQKVYSIGHCVLCVVCNSQFDPVTTGSNCSDHLIKLHLNLAYWGTLLWWHQNVGLRNRPALKWVIRWYKIIIIFTYNFSNMLKGRL